MQTLLAFLALIVGGIAIGFGFAIGGAFWGQSQGGSPRTGLFIAVLVTALLLVVLVVTGTPMPFGR